MVETDSGKEGRGVGFVSQYFPGLAERVQWYWNQCLRGMIRRRLLGGGGFRAGISRFVGQGFGGNGLRFSCLLQFAEGLVRAT